MIGLELCVLERKTTEVKCCFYHIISRIHTISVLSPLVKTSSTYLRGYLPGLSTVNFFFFPLFHTVFPGKK